MNLERYNEGCDLFYAKDTAWDIEKIGRAYFTECRICHHKISDSNYSRASGRMAAHIFGHVKKRLLYKLTELRTMAENVGMDTDDIDDRIIRAIEFQYPGVVA